MWGVQCRPISSTRYQFLFVAAMLFLLIRHLRPMQPAPELASPLAPEKETSFLVSQNGFAENAVYITTRLLVSPEGLLPEGCTPGAGPSHSPS
jgi:hypothetical protein